jgi:cell wall-associated NlpC family hydrolase
MYLKRNAFFKILILCGLLIVLAACAPKRVRIYDMSDPTRSNIVVSALALQGKPYKNAARGPDAFDCSGLVYYVFKQYRVSLPPPAEAQGRIGQAINRDSALPGDLVFFKIEGDFHVGIIISGVEFVHASKSRGVAIDNLDTSYWRKRLIGYRSVL